MQRLFCFSQNISGDKIIITDKNDIYHLRDVLRLKENDTLIAVDEKGNEYNCRIEKITKQLILQIKDKQAPDINKKTRLTLACAIPKKSKMDDIIDKLTQLGVDAIIPLLTERVVVKLDKHKEGLRAQRWQKIALSAAKQCQRNTVPVIQPVTDIKNLLKDAKDSDLKLIPTLSGDRKTLKELLNRDSDHFFNNKKMVAVPGIFVLIGPEGDFSPAEIDLAKKAGFIPVSLGDLVLRVDTAAIAVASYITLQTGNT